MMKASGYLEALSMPIDPNTTHPTAPMMAGRYITVNPAVMYQRTCRLKSCTAPRAVEISARAFGSAMHLLLRTPTPHHTHRDADSNTHSSSATFAAGVHKARSCSSVMGLPLSVRQTSLLSASIARLCVLPRELLPRVWHQPAPRRFSSDTTCARCCISVSVATSLRVCHALSMIQSPREWVCATGGLLISTRKRTGSLSGSWVFEVVSDHPLDLTGTGKLTKNDVELSSWCVDPCLHP
mmetsp:Transcript_63315/g.102394  ORF Transcript_63315/g.102394 Transcript_63315/m.102394 type:complete len:239 (+) Transcript_63315:911-1627(+)